MFECEEINPPVERRESKFMQIFDGLPMYDSGSHRGQTNHKEAAKVLGLSEEEYKKCLAVVKGMYSRQPDSTITLIEYVDKLCEANLSPNDVGVGSGKYQAGRNDDTGPYTKENFMFITQEENLKQRNENLKGVPKYNSRQVHTPFGVFDSLAEAERNLDTRQETIAWRINSSNKEFDDWFYTDAVSEKLWKIMRREGKQFHASDNVSEFLDETKFRYLKEETTANFERVLRSLLIDVENDPNSMGTAKRLMKMYFGEIMSGRYYPAPNVTAFPNTDKNRYEGMLVVRSEIKSMCSHHHQPVTGVCYIGVLPSDKVIGLSKYTRIAQWCARRGTLQEELTNEIARQIMDATDSRSVGVYIQAEHGCCTNRGIMAKSSLTQTTVLHGEFHDPSVKKEFFDNIQLQQMRNND